MKIRIILQIVVLVCASSSLAFAQATSPAQVDLSYHFKPGTTLHYKKVEEFRNPDNPPGLMEGNWDRIEDIHITVEKVDSLDDATLVIHNEETHDFKGGDDGDGVTQGGLALEIPLYRVKVDRYGRYLSGEILHRSTQDSLNQIGWKDTNNLAKAPPDSASIISWMAQLLSRRPTRTGVREGARWQDSTTKISHPTTFYFNHTASSSTKKPDGPNYQAHHFDYTIDQDAADRKAGQYKLATETTNYQVIAGELIFKGKIDEEQDIRSSDGLIISRTSTDRRIAGRNVDNSYGKRTLTLISIDSTAH